MYSGHGYSTRKREKACSSICMQVQEWKGNTGENKHNKKKSMRAVELNSPRPVEVRKAQLNHSWTFSQARKTLALLLKGYKSELATAGAATMMDSKIIVHCSRNIT
ncbi:hypothetical protein XENOCAPTIV_030072 [Xenoophorus captivus]|uniref:Uncharacterized protein n=1 Tax=Xenoophorus captivus TaxID=1517983 RepID=A0ABV0RYI5_9TELE